MFRQVPESVHRSYLAEALRCSCRSWFSLVVNRFKLHGQILESCIGVNLKADAARDTKKSCGYFQSTNLTQTYRFIKAEEGNFPVRLLCKTLNVSKSAYYSYCKGTTLTKSD